MLHFAYGSNMHAAVMRKHAPAAEPVGVARLAGYRFVITADGYASVDPARAEVVHGVLWRITPHDRVTLDMWENIAAGLYRAMTLPVRGPAGRRMALVYRARPRAAGHAKPGYMDIVIAAARTWNLPPDYIASLQRWSRPHRGGADPRKIREFGWM